MRVDDWGPTRSTSQSGSSSSLMHQGKHGRVPLTPAGAIATTTAGPELGLVRSADLSIARLAGPVSAGARYLPRQAGVVDRRLPRPCRPVLARVPAAIL